MRFLRCLLWCVCEKAGWRLVTLSRWALLTWVDLLTAFESEPACSPPVYMSMGKEVGSTEYLGSWQAGRHPWGDF